MDKLIHGVGRYWFFILIGVLALFGVFTEDNGGTKTPLPPPTKNPTVRVSEYQPDITPGISLPTGTILKKWSPYLDGDGKLEIKNGTDFDAVAKLIRDGSSILTVYIKANDKYTIQNISDGTYWLAFVQGNDWNSASKRFNRNTKYSAFEETFDFITSSSEYTIFEVTLNPVAGGTAATDEVDPSQFDAY